MIELLPSTIRMRPGFDLKDWNDILLANTVLYDDRHIPFLDSEITRIQPRNSSARGVV